MLQRNPLQPPRPFAVQVPARLTGRAAAEGFVSAEDYDSTGVLSGVDPCESRYWWMPELYGPEPAAAMAGGEHQAARRASSRAPAAA